MFIDRHQGDVRQVRPADIGGRIKAPQAELTGGFVQPFVLFGAQPQALALGLAGQHAGLQRHKLVGHEPADQIGQHPVFFAQFEIHDRSSRRRAFCRRRAHCSRGEGLAWKEASDGR